MGRPAAGRPHSRCCSACWQSRPSPAGRSAVHACSTTRSPAGSYRTAADPRRLRYRAHRRKAAGGGVVRVALFITCLVDGLFPDVGKATVTLLERLGHSVDVPMSQTCCGQMHLNTGYTREARPMVRAFAGAFEG